MALSLYPQHKRSKICRQLRLSGGQFKRRLEGLNSEGITTSGFVLASNRTVTTTSNPSARAQVQLSIQGKERLLTLCVAADVFLQMVPNIIVLL
jgi:hypothetical protein